MSKIMSIDQSLTGTGVSFGAWNSIGEKVAPYGYQIIKTKPGTSDTVRIKFIKDKLLSLADQYGINLVLLEDYAYGAKNRAQQSGEIGGVIKNAFHELVPEVPVIIMPIGTHKLFTTGLGNAKKDLMLKEVYKKYGVDTNNDNIADSISILMTFIGYIEWDGGAVISNKKVITSFKKLKDSILLNYPALKGNI
jgi:Holliday junction resolvasome RuvABC endonuclease subunit